MYEVDQYTVALLHFEDGLKDECGNTWTANGSVTLDTTNKSNGNSSLKILAGTYLKSSNDKYAFGSGDFTIDFWVYSDSPNSCNFTSSAVLGGSIGVAVCGDKAWVGNNGAAEGHLDVSTIPANTWTHISVVRYQGEFSLFIQGKLIKKAKMVGTISAKQFAIGSRYAGGDYGNSQLMFIDEYRISNIARWTSDFNPPNSTTEEINTPTNLTAIAGDSQVTLSWNTVTGATSYNIKRSINAGGSYATIATNITDTSYIDTAVANGTTYYYIVTAIDENGNESASSNEVSATPKSGTVTPPTGNALLRVTMIDSSEREYRLTSTEITGFINWYTRTIGTGISCYAVKDIIDNSTEYLAFEKIISFKVMELTK